MIEGVLFDVDGVLLDSKAANITWFRDFLSRYGYTHLTEEQLLPGHYLSLREGIAAITRADEATVNAIFEDVRDLREYPNHLLVMRHGSTRIVEVLRNTYKLGIVTSRIEASVQQFLRFSHLHVKHFSVIVEYEDSTRHKPSPDPLRVACRRMNLGPESVVYVGDAPSDEVCARAAGTHFIGLGDGVPGAATVIQGFDELEAAIRGLAS